jgi:hypothetical protein
LTFLAQQQVYPGDECAARVTVVHPDYVRGYLTVGACFDIMEGPQKVGEGTILSIPAVLSTKESREARGKGSKSWL